jgi:Cu/Ag efflux pump CusA
MIIGLSPMALKLGEGSESYAPLARALIGGSTLSVVVTVFIVPVGFFLAYRKRSSSENLILMSSSSAPAFPATINSPSLNS